MSTAGMEEPAEFDIVIKKGSEFSLPFVVSDESGFVDVSNYSFKSQLLTAPGGTVLLNFVIEKTAPVSGACRLYAAASSTALIPSTATGGYKDATIPQKFTSAFWDLIGAPSASTATQDMTYMQGVGKIYPRGTTR